MPWALVCLQGAAAITEMTLSLIFESVRTCGTTRGAHERQQWTKGDLQSSRDFLIYAPPTPHGVNGNHTPVASTSAAVSYWKTAPERLLRASPGVMLALCIT